jgi:hypothetical protein
MLAGCQPRLSPFQQLFEEAGMMLNAINLSVAPTHLSIAVLLLVQVMPPPHLDVPAVFEAQLAVISNKP